MVEFRLFKYLNTLENKGKLSYGSTFLIQDLSHINWLPPC